MANDFTGRSDLPRGIRNNNPGNIKADGTIWQGNTGDDGIFVTFANIDWGTRALATDLANKIRKGENTIRLIVETYAPPVENNTARYIAAVMEDTGLDADMALNMDQVTLHSLVRAIMNHENGPAGSALVTDADIDQGMAMMNNTLQTLFQAAGIAAENVIKDVTGQGSGGSGSSSTGLVLLAVLIGGLIILSGHKK